MLADGAFDLVPGDGTYTIFGNLFPEIVGFVVIGRQIIAWLIQPISKISFETTMLEKLYLGRKEEVKEDEEYDEC